MIVGKKLTNLIKIKEADFFKGVYSGSGALELHGNFEGVLIINSIHVKKTGVFTGKLSAQTIIVEGEVCADIETETLHLKKSGVIDGDLVYRNLVIESGGLLKSTRVYNMSKNNDLININSNN